MALTVVVEGIQCERTIENRLVLCTPFIGISADGSLDVLALGYRLDDGSDQQLVMGVPTPYPPVRMWRTLMLLSQVPQILEETLPSAWEVMCEDVLEEEPELWEGLEELFPGFAQLKEEIAQVMEWVPEESVLNAIVAAICVNQWPLDSNEIIELVEAKRLEPTNFLDEAVQEERARREKEALLLARISKPVEADNSIVQFFVELGLGNFIIGELEGIYHLHWRHLDRACLDKVVRYCSYTGRKCFDLLHTGRAPVGTVSVMESVVMIVLSCGEIGHPVHVSGNATSYAFLQAREHEGSFLIRTRLTRNEETIGESWYPVVRLRQLIGMPINGGEDPLGIG